jgi:hypothetical protein
MLRLSTNGVRGDRQQQSWTRTGPRDSLPRQIREYAVIRTKWICTRSSTDGQEGHMP